MPGGKDGPNLVFFYLCKQVVASNESFEYTSLPLCLYCVTKDTLNIFYTASKMKVFSGLGAESNLPDSLHKNQPMAVTEGLKPDCIKLKLDGVHP